ncbi:MAG TPA: NTP transferase domain-containing protein [Steroidobacteraceae bacterium]|jgi:molybdopterin-guanine dinucleotide biosynthesis protein A|nr:NTP transferase domain-containing protein [Steroidobacteraceae bacterium]
MAPPLYGLVLAGGRSTRMQRDKATLSYQGRTQLDRAMDLLDSRVRQGFVSVRADQREDPARARYPQVIDAHAGLGPIAGIAAAQALKPGAAWLVLACDLPYLGPRTVAHLLAHRDPARTATAYRSSHDGLPEPLCAIYEPRAAAQILERIDAGKSCPRKFLIQADVLLLDQPDPRALDNINTPEEYDAARGTLLAPQGPDSMQIKVQYYAILREQAGRSEETVATAARTPRDLYAELQRRHPFSLGADSLRVAINAEFSDWSQPLTEGDAVVFIPPVAGG